jgi:putative AdoMet-dependent methyltransferase
VSIYTPTPQEFDDWAATLDQDILVYADKFPFVGYAQVLDEVVLLANAGPGLAVLDLGIGTGNLAGRFLARNCQVYGLDFSAKMLAAARVKYPQLHLAQADLLADWPAMLQQAFDRTRFEVIVSGYTFHHFDLPTKVALLVRLAADHLVADGRIVIGDIAFKNAAARDAAQQYWGDLWEEEDYWIADETLETCHQAGLQVIYEQISSCGGVFAIQPVSYYADKEQS